MAAALMLALGLKASHVCESDYERTRGRAVVYFVVVVIVEALSAVFLFQTSGSIGLLGYQLSPLQRYFVILLLLLVFEVAGRLFRPQKLDTTLAVDRLVWLRPQEAIQVLFDALTPITLLQLDAHGRNASPAAACGRYAAQGLRWADGRRRTIDSATGACRLPLVMKSPVFFRPRNSVRMSNQHCAGNEAVIRWPASARRRPKAETCRRRLGMDFDVEHQIKSRARARLFLFPNP